MQASPPKRNVHLSSSNMSCKAETRQMRRGIVARWENEFNSPSTKSVQQDPSCRTNAETHEDADDGMMAVKGDDVTLGKYHDAVEMAVRPRLSDGIGSLCAVFRDFARTS